MAREYCINGELYSTQAELTDRIRTLVSRYPDGVALRPTDHDFVVGVLELHQERDAKVGCGVRNFTVETNRNHGARTRGFWITRLDGTRTDFSWVKCLRPATHVQDVRKACRDAIGAQILEFKRRTLAAGPVHCPYTGQLLSLATAHADHAHPDTFLALLDRFLAAEGLKYGVVAVVPTADGELYNRLVDRELERRWLEFHAQNARLRLLSRTGNLSDARIQS